MNWKEDYEYITIIKDLLMLDAVRELANFVHHHVTDRLSHSIRVSYKSYLIAKKRNWDYRSVARAGLLHDLYHYTTKEVNGLGRGGHNKVHPMIALESASSLVSLNDLEKDIIEKHMFLTSWVLPKYKESFLVSMVDKYVSFSEVLNPSAYLELLNRWRQLSISIIIKEDNYENKVNSRLRI